MRVVFLCVLRIGLPVSLGGWLTAGLLLPAAYLLSKTGNIDNIWWSFLIAEFASAAVGAVYFRKVKREQLDKLEG